MTWSFAMLTLVALMAVPLSAAPHYEIFSYSGYASPGSTVYFGVHVSPGEVLRKPRFHFIRDGDPFPSTRSRLWIEFPDTTGVHSFELTAPKQFGVWWLLLYEGSKLSARERVEIVTVDESLERVKRDLDAMVAKARIYAESSPDGSIPSQARETGQTSTNETGQMSTKGMMLLRASGEIRMGDSLEITADPQGTTGDLVLAWGDTADFSWSDKELGLRDEGPEVPVPTVGRISVLAPVRRPGRYDLRLFRGSDLLDVLTVSVK